MTVLLRDSEVRALVSFPEAVDVVAAGVVSVTEADEVVRSTARFGGGWLRIMSGTLQSEDLLGFKAFHLIPGHGVRYLITVYRLSDGEPLAMIDGNYVTVARTSAAAAAAASRFFGDRPVTLGIIGSGTLARDGVRALASVCRVREARVYSRRPENREPYALELGAELGIDVRPAAASADATADCDMVLCATQTQGDVALQADAVGPARYVSSVSSTLPRQRELDGSVIASASLVVIDTRDALHESGDLLAAAEAGLEEHSVMLLSDYLSREPEPSTGRVVYKSIGSVEQDLALAGAVFRAAEQTGAGQHIDPVEAPRM